MSIFLFIKHLSNNNNKEVYSHHFKTSTAIREHEDVILGLLLPIVPLGQEPVLLVFLTTHPVNRSVFILAVCAVCPRPHTHCDLHLLDPGVCHVVHQPGVCHTLLDPGVCHTLLDQELETTCKNTRISFYYSLHSSLFV